MKKYFPMLTLVVLLINLTWVSPAFAGEALWQLFWTDENALLEHLTIAQDQAQNAGSEWEKSGKTTLSRKTKDWQAYNQLSERLPLKAQVNDYIVFRSTTLEVDKPASESQLLKDVAAGGCLVAIEVPGYIKKNPAGELKELTVSWDLSRIMIMKQGELLLQTYTLNGFYLGSVLFLLGFISIAVFFALKTRGINKLIDERYSLDRIGEIDDEIDDWK